MADFTPQEIEQFLQEFFDVVGARQYVGARYVPIFGRAGEDTIEWDDRAPYEPLTVVMHDGVSYVSRRYVPGGIQITDTAYWVETYRFNAQVEQYRQEVLSFQGQIDELREDLESDYVPFPDAATLPKYGTLGQVLSTLMGGETKWVDPLTIDAETAGPIIEAWLDDHPEATTSVEDDSITDAKLKQSQLLSVLGLKTLTVLAQYVTNAGTLNTNGDYRHSLVNLKAGERITVRLYALNAVSALSRQLTPTTFDPIAIGTGSLSNYSYTALEDCTIAISYDSSQYYSCFIEDTKEHIYSNYILNYGATGNIDDLNSIQQNSVVVFQNKNVSHWPSGVNYSSRNIVVTIITTQDEGEFAGYLFGNQYIFNVAQICVVATREISASNWEPWVILNPQFYGANVQVTNATNFDELSAGAYSFFTDTTLSQLPSLNWGGRNIVITTRQSPKNHYLGDSQIIFCETSHAIVTRVHNGTAWQSWVISTLPYFMSRAANDPLDFNNLPSGIVSFVSTGQYAQLPSLDWAGRNIVITVRKNPVALQEWDSQIVYCETSQVICSRVYYNGAWNNWTLKYIKQRTIEIGAGKQYTTLRAGFEAARNATNCKVIVYSGTYDLTTEFSDVLSDHSGKGLYLGNNNHYLFLAGSHVVCNVDVSNTWAYSNFEPFWADTTNFVLEGLNISGKNTRYCVHDECNGVGTYRHEYINCFMEHADENQSANYPQCIGGGLGVHGYINIVGGHYKSSALYAQTHYATADDMQMPITYHNGYNANCDGKICISGVYLADKGYFRFGSYGPSTILTPVEISNCRMHKPPYMMQEQFNPSEPTNFELISFNNEIVNP